MQQINSLERAFTVLTYFLSAKDFYNNTDNEKVCLDLDSASYLGRNNLWLVNQVMRKKEFYIKNNYSKQGQPYECVDSSIGNLFCEDNRYSKNLIIIGRGQKAPTHDLYKKMFSGIACNKTCIEGNNDFFIGWNEFVNLYSKKAYGLLIVYNDTADIENFLYIPDVSVDNKKIKFTNSRSSMLNFTLNGLLENKSLTDLHINNWKIFLKIKD